MLYRNTITDKMYEVATVLNSILDESYYLAGGTALSLHIGHRESVDLDYFTNHEIDIKELYSSISQKFINSKVVVTYEEKNTLWLNIDNVKVSFITRRDALVKDLKVDDVFKLASVDDILLMKLSAICGRSEYKDYYDLARISKLVDVRSWVTMWQKSFPNSDPLSFIVALNDIDNVPYLELKGQNIKSRSEVVKTIKDIVAEINSFLF